MINVSQRRIHFSSVILQRRFNSHLASIARTQAPALIYRLTSNDPYLNLSIEHYIFQRVPITTTVLLFYINRPSIIIGRNQNPWLEINLPLLRSTASQLPSPTQAQSSSSRQSKQPGQRLLDDKIDFVRRRSGGGTVFHDEGNVNWGVICDANAFTRNKHADMVVRGIQRAGVPNVRVNERHDIVMFSSLPLSSSPSSASDEGHPQEHGQVQTRKVSGSAYKLARGRALHHGTALCCSQNLHGIPRFLRSPAKEMITAKGVDSVRSPITNLKLNTDMFCDGVEAEFRRMYDVPGQAQQQQQPVVELGHECLEIQEVRDGYDELQSEEWRYLQTPQFDFRVQSSTYGTFTFSAKHGIITTAQWTLPSGEELVSDKSPEKIVVHEVQSWRDAIQHLMADQITSVSSEQIVALGAEVDALLVNANLPPWRQIHEKI